MNNKKRILLILCVSFTISIGVIPPAPSFAQPVHKFHEWHKIAPYGGYCPGSRWGWYGAKRMVRTSEEAGLILREYFPADIKIGLIRERKWFFEAEILDKNNRLIDIVIVNKRTGRIRSIF